MFLSPNEMYGQFSKGNKIIDDEIICQIICWLSRGTTMVMEVKLDYFHGCGSTTVVALKNQVQLKKLRIAKFIQKWKKKFFTAIAMVLPRPRKQCNFTSVTVVLPRFYQQMILWICPYCHRYRDCTFIVQVPTMTFHLHIKYFFR